MLFRWIRLHLIFCHFQCLNQTFTGLSRIDDFVDESQLGSLIRSGELFLVGFQFFRLSLCIRFAEQDIYRAFCPHYCDFRAWIGKVYVCACLLGVHHNVCTAVSLTGDNGQFGNGSFRECINDFRAVADDTVIFLRVSRKEARNIFESNQRNVETVAETDETARWHQYRALRQGRQADWRRYLPNDLPDVQNQ